MRRRRLKKLRKRLQALQQQNLNRDPLLFKVGAAKKEAGRAYFPVDLHRKELDQAVTPETFSFSLRRQKLRSVRRREGQSLLRSNPGGKDPALWWRYYIQLTEVEQAFKELQGDLSIGPIYHRKDSRIEACLSLSPLWLTAQQAPLKHRLRPLAPGLTPISANLNYKVIEISYIFVTIPVQGSVHEKS